ncbi:hypothetical protein SAMN05660443_0219 [Marinospirillum celere]|uniref:Uncharacterized protein n=1 Tax=Marinospirillum celere TaxID=1122252 RepID=A0A1I1E4T0_9GAMM|nr:hypothetical protein [Marinospirillum celere]SFB80228.1 hypothetical protein SAMN05660443_0219 [Marinospirillum celere]
MSRSPDFDKADRALDEASRALSSEREFYERLPAGLSPKYLKLMADLAGLQERARKLQAEFQRKELL